MVPNGLFESDVELHASRDATRRELELDEQDFAVLCVANLRPEKGVAAFAEAVARARAPAAPAARAGGGRRAAAGRASRGSRTCGCSGRAATSRT